MLRLIRSTVVSVESDPHPHFTYFGHPLHHCLGRGAPGCTPEILVSPQCTPLTLVSFWCTPETLVSHRYTPRGIGVTPRDIGVIPVHPKRRWCHPSAPHETWVLPRCTPGDIGVTPVNPIRHWCHPGAPQEALVSPQCTPEILVSPR